MDEETVEKATIEIGIVERVVLLEGPGMPLASEDNRFYHLRAEQCLTFGARQPEKNPCKKRLRRELRRKSWSGRQVRGNKLFHR